MKVGSFKIGLFIAVLGVAACLQGHGQIVESPKPQIPITQGIPALQPVKLQKIEPIQQLNVQPTIKLQNVPVPSKAANTAIPQVAQKLRQIAVQSPTIHKDDSVKINEAEHDHHDTVNVTIGDTGQRTSIDNAQNLPADSEHNVKVTKVHKKRIEPKQNVPVDTVPKLPADTTKIITPQSSSNSIFTSSTFWIVAVLLAVVLFLNKKKN